MSEDIEKLYGIAVQSVKELARALDKSGDRADAMAAVEALTKLDKISPLRKVSV
jgi:hypothetical protein